VVFFTTRICRYNCESKAVKKAVSLPADLAAEIEAIARDESKSLSAVVQDALRARAVENRRILVRIGRTRCSPQEISCFSTTSLTTAFPSVLRRGMPM
jgi:Ribbon-helix-helix protein, copG family